MNIFTFIYLTAFEVYLRFLQNIFMNHIYMVQVFFFFFGGRLLVLSFKKHTRFQATAHVFKATPVIYPQEPQQ